MVELARCPHCGALALEDAVFCVECGGRMLPRSLVSSPRTSPLGSMTAPLGTPVPGVPPSSNANVPSPLTLMLHPAATIKASPGQTASNPNSAAEAVPAIPAEVGGRSPFGGAMGQPSKGRKGRSAVSNSNMPSIDEVDRSFETILSSPPPQDPTLTVKELQEAQQLFREIAASYLGPVRALMLELSLAEPGREWLAVCRPPLASMKRAASDMLLTELAAALDVLSNVMERVEQSSPAVLDGAAREALRVAYRPLIALLPEAFSVEDERDRREPIIVQSLLRQVSELRTVALDRIFAAGLVSLEMFYQAKPSDISEAAGISRDLAERVVARFQRYRRELGSLPPAEKDVREYGALEGLTQRLENQNASFEATQKAFSQSEEGRKVRQERNSTLLEINLFLARLGQIPLLERLERLPFRSKAEELRRFLSAPKN